MKDNRFKVFLSNLYKEPPAASPHLSNEIWKRINENKVTLKEKVYFSLSMASVVLCLIYSTIEAKEMKQIQTKTDLSFYYYEGTSTEEYSFGMN